MMGENVIMIDKLKLIIGESMLIRNTLWMLGGQGFRVMIQALYFILLARLLGAEGLGTFVGVVSLVGIVAPFANLGSGNLLVKNAARDPRLFRAYWGRGLMVTSVTASSLIAAILLASSLLLPRSIPFGLVLCVALADLLFARLLELSGQAFMAFQRLRRTAQLQAMLSLAMLFAAAWLGLAGPAPTAATWGCCYLAVSACVGVAAVLLACRERGRPGLDRGRHASELGEGALFSISQSTEGIYANIDKYMLLRISAPGTAGLYAAAYRLIDVASTPMNSLFAATYARFFQHGVEGIRGTLRFTRRILPLALAYGFGVGLALFLAAPLLPMVLGRDFERAVEVVRWLAFLPLIGVVHNFAGDTLTGAGFQGVQGVRSAVEVLVALTNVLLNLWLIPLYSWRGAAGASLAAGGLLALGLWASVWLIHRRGSKLVLTGLQPG
jgi:O-antigen/teichoic acid export membrane protein